MQQPFTYQAGQVYSYVPPLNNLPQVQPLALNPPNQPIVPDVEIEPFYSSSQMKPPALNSTFSLVLMPTETLERYRHYHKKWEGQKRNKYKEYQPISGRRNKTVTWLDKAEQRYSIILADGISRDYCSDNITSNLYSAIQLNPLLAIGDRALREGIISVRTKQAQSTTSP